ncbi:MAG: hypothetical protein SNI54_04715 [Rikenellaceae bacterium]
MSGGGSRIGGVVGNTSSLTSCYNTGSVSGSGSRIGGVVGYVSSSLTTCYNTGSVSGIGDYVGGVVGYSSSSSLLSACYFIDQAEDDATGGVGNSTSSSYTYMILSSKSELNAVIDTMNTAAGDTYYEQDTNNVNDGYPILVNIDYQ